LTTIIYRYKIYLFSLFTVISGSTGINFRKQEIDSIVDGLSAGNTVVVFGSRGTGKSTALRKVANLLEQKEPNSVSLIDLEDPKSEFSGEIPPIKYLLIDEIKKFKNWIGWFNKLEDKKNRGIAICFSGTLPSELKHHQRICFHPLGLKEWLTQYTDKSVNYDRLEYFLHFGGLISGLENQDSSKALSELIYSSILHDILLSEEVRNPSLLTDMTVKLISMTGQSISVSRLKDMFGSSVDQTRAFLKHIENSGLIRLITRIEDSQRPRAQSARRVFAVDPGLSVAISATTPKLRDLAETAVLNELIRRDLKVLAWRYKQTSGLAIIEHDSAVLLIDISDGDSYNDLANAMSHYDCPRGLFLSKNKETKNIELKTGVIYSLPIWTWLSNPQVQKFDQSWTLPQPSSLTDIPQLPRHLL
jgi:predicted AAA+ superfamily ATPase